MSVNNINPIFLSCRRYQLRTNIGSNPRAKSVQCRFPSSFQRKICHVAMSKRDEDGQSTITENWYERGIHSIFQLHNGFGNPKTFEDLVIEFDIPIRDQKKYDSLMNGIFLEWFDNSLNVDENIFNQIFKDLLSQKKMSKYTYNILLKKYSCTNAKRESKWEELFGHQPKERGLVDYSYE